MRRRSRLLRIENRCEVPTVRAKPAMQLHLLFRRTLYPIQCTPSDRENEHAIKLSAVSGFLLSELGTTLPNHLLRPSRLVSRDREKREVLPSRGSRDDEPPCSPTLVIAVPALRFPQEPRVNHTHALRRYALACSSRRPCSRLLPRLPL